MPKARPDGQLCWPSLTVPPRAAAPLRRPPPNHRGAAPLRRPLPDHRRVAPLRRPPPDHLGVAPSAGLHQTTAALLRSLSSPLSPRRKAGGELLQADPLLRFLPVPRLHPQPSSPLKQQASQQPQQRGTEGSRPAAARRFRPPLRTRRRQKQPPKGHQHCQLESLGAALTSSREQTRRAIEAKTEGEKKQRPLVRVVRRVSSSPPVLTVTQTSATQAALVMTLEGNVYGEGSDGEEVFIDDEDIINEIPLDEEDLPDQDDDDEQEQYMMDEIDDDSAYAFHGHTDEVFAAACSPADAMLVVSGGKDDRGFLWRIGSAEDVQELPGHKDTVCTVAFSSDGKLVACGSMDGQINVWNTATRTLHGTLEASESGFEWLKWHPQDHLIIAGSEDCNVWMWNAAHNAFPNILAGHSSTVTCGDFTPDGKLICSGSDDATLRIWDRKSAQCRHVVRGHSYHTQGLTCLAITWDSQSIVSGSQDNSVHIVSINSGQVVGSLVGHTNSVECIGISPRYNWVATGSIDQTLIIWDLAHQAIRSTCEHDEGVTCLAWLGSSKYVASGCIDGTVCIWDSLSGELAHTFSGHRDTVQSLAVSADCNSIVSVSSDKSARVFDISMFK